MRTKYFLTGISIRLTWAIYGNSSRILKCRKSQNNWLSRLQKISVYFLVTFTIILVFAGNLLQWQQYRIKHAMEERLEKEKLITLTISINNLIWHKKGKEIIVDKQMFDVKSIQYNADGSVTVAGLFDHEEKALHKKLADLINNKKERNSSFAKYFSLQLFTPVKLRFDSLLFQIVKNYSLPLHNDLIQRTKDVNTPPPKIT